jgi:hypothetical protein
MPIEIWKWSPVLGHHYRELPDVTGQIQAQAQSAATESVATAYMRYPKEHDRLRDSWDYGGAAGSYDAVAFPLPGGRKVFYAVAEVQGMGMGFPNAHLVATLLKLSALEAAAVQPPYPPGDWLSVDLSSISHSPAVIPFQDPPNPTINYATIVATVKRSTGAVVPGIAIEIISDSPTEIILAPDGVTDEAGQYTTTSTNSAEETTHVFGVVPGMAGAIGPSDGVDWNAGGAPQLGVPGAITAAGCENNVGTNCGVINGTYTLSADDSGGWVSDELFDLGYPSYQAVRWWVYHDGSLWWVALGQSRESGTAAQYNSQGGDVIGSGLTVVLAALDAYVCSFPSEVLIEP